MTNQGAYIETLQKDKIRDTKVQIEVNIPMYLTEAQYRN